MNSTVAGDATAAIVSVFTFVDYSVFGVLLGISLAIGIYFGFFDGTEQTTEEYLQGSHKMQVLPIAISLIASQLSAISIMTIPVEVYSYGWQYMLLLPMLILITIASNYLFVPVFYHNKIDNCYAYLEYRFSKTVRNLVTILFVALGTLFSPVLLYIPSLAFVEVTGLNIYIVNAVVSYCCVLYTMLGGIKAVVWTDVVQATVMVSSVVLVACIGVAEVGGVSAVWDRAIDGGRIFAPNFAPSLTSRHTFWNMSLGALVIWTCHVTFNQSCAQRIVSLPTLKKSQQSLWIFCIGVIFIMFFNCSTGIIMYAYYHGCDPVLTQTVSRADKMIPRFVQDVAGRIPGMPGIFISAVFSASLSMVSASLNAKAGLIYSDFVRPLKIIKHTERNANLTMKAIVFLLGTHCAVSVILVEKFASIFEVINSVFGTMVGAVFAVFTLGMLWPWANKHGALAGVLIGTLSMVAVIVNTQVAIFGGRHGYTPIPSTNSSCGLNETTFRVLNHLSTEKSSEDGFAFYKIAFMWYGPMGALITWISAIVVSALTGGQDFNNFNITLLAPCIQSLVPRKYRHTELETMSHIPQMVVPADNVKAELRALMEEDEKCAEK